MFSFNSWYWIRISKTVLLGGSSIDAFRDQSLFRAERIREAVKTQACRRWINEYIFIAAEDQPNVPELHLNSAVSFLELYTTGFKNSDIFKNVGFIYLYSKIYLFQLLITVLMTVYNIPEAAKKLVI